MAIIALAIAVLTFGILAGLVAAALLTRGPLIELVAKSVARYQENERQKELHRRQSKLRGPTLRLKSGALSDSDEPQDEPAAPPQPDPAEVEEAAIRQEKINAGKVIQAEREGRDWPEVLSGPTAYFFDADDRFRGVIVTDGKVKAVSPASFRTKRDALTAARRAWDSGSWQQWPQPAEV